MHGIIFEGTAEESAQRAAGGPAEGSASAEPPPRRAHIHLADCLDLRGSAELMHFTGGDVVWIVTRLGGERSTPGLCGRLVVDRSEPLTGDEHPEPAEPGDHAERRLIVRAADSSRCAPFACGVIASWDIWRQQFRGVRLLEEEQGAALERAWSRSRG